MSYLDYYSITLQPLDVLNLTGSLAILPEIEPTQFYDIDKIILKLKYNSIPYNYGTTDLIYFSIANEHIATLQGDSISSNHNVVTVANARLCKDLCAPLIELGETVKMQFSGSSPTVGDSEIEITTYYYLHDF